VNDLRLSIHGTVFALHSGRPEIREAIRARWRYFEPGRLHRNVRRVDIDERVGGGDLLAVRRSAHGAFLQQVAAALFPRQIVLHAALIRSKAGLDSALVIGGSGAGKSTVAAVARGRGLQAPGDDLVALSVRGRARPWPILSGIRPPTEELLRDLELPVVRSSRHSRTRDFVASCARPTAIHLLDGSEQSAAGALFAHSFGAWSPRPAAFLAELLARIEGIPVHRHPALDLADGEKRSQAIEILERILTPLGAVVPAIGPNRATAIVTRRGSAATAVRPAARRRPDLLPA
jgi:hypothetical protein